MIAGDCIAGGDGGGVDEVDGVGDDLDERVSALRGTASIRAAQSLELAKGCGGGGVRGPPVEDPSEHESLKLKSANVLGENSSASANDSGERRGLGADCTARFVFSLRGDLPFFPVFCVGIGTGVLSAETTIGNACNMSSSLWPLRGSAGRAAERTGCVATGVIEAGCSRAETMFVGESAVLNTI